MNKNSNVSALDKPRRTTKPNIGNRILAGTIDYAIIFAFFYLYLFAFGKPNNEGEYSVEGPLGLVPIVFWGIMTIGLEQWLGATLGNSLVGLKPVSIHTATDNTTFNEPHAKPSFTQFLKRHLLDPIDMCCFGLVGIISLKNTSKNQSLGDLWGNTVVVRTKN